MVGKGPSFHLWPDNHYDIVIAINDAIIPTQVVYPDAWLCFRDYSIHSLLRYRYYNHHNIYCPDRYRDTYPKATTFLFSNDWHTFNTLARSPSLPYTTSSAIWLAYKLGATRIITTGIGDPRREYHPAFTGTPQTDGLGPWYYLNLIAQKLNITVEKQ